MAAQGHDEAVGVVDPLHVPGAEGGEQARARLVEDEHVPFVPVEARRAQGRRPRVAEELAAVEGSRDVLAFGPRQGCGRWGPVSAGEGEGGELGCDVRVG